MKIGNATLTITDDEFPTAYQAGYVRYKTDFLNKPLTDMEIYAFSVGVMTSVLHSGRYSAGYLTGWVTALLEVTKPSTSDALFLDALVKEVEL